ncbi:VTT domain-containing protein [uncultured Shewanella sp.]|uniref:3-dehydroquinate synthase family protein n=1 Tax=uncultured Shewanella sp. TaxID=173975 RepID=UPI0026368250|nr:VTT domain-containing protein [uncultured Shewanella sp.]
MLRSAHLCILLTSLTLMVILSFLFLEQNTTEIISNTFLKLQQESQQTYLSAIFLILILSINVILPVPDNLASVFATSHFNHFLAPMIICIGLTISSMVGYWLGSTLHKITSQHKSNYPMTDKTKKSAHSASIIMLILFRAIPVLAEISVITAGIIRLPFKQFIWLIILSNIGLAFAYNQLGVLASSSHSILFLIIASTLLPSSIIAIRVCHAFITHLLAHKEQHINRRTKAVLTTQKSAPISASHSLSPHVPVFVVNHLWSTVPNQPSPLLTFLNAQQSHSHFCCVLDQNILKKHVRLSEDIQHFFNLYSHLNLIAPPIVTKVDPVKTIKALLPFLLTKDVSEKTLFIAVGAEGLFNALRLTLNQYNLTSPTIYIPSSLSTQAYTSIIEHPAFTKSVSEKTSKPASAPWAIFNDFSLLAPVQKQDQLRGLILIIKIALLKDAQFFNWIEINIKPLLASEAKETQYAISRCTQLILQHIKSSSHFYHQENVSQLEYGQWSLQAISNKLALPLEHAEVIATGILLDAYYSSQIGLLSQDNTLRVVKLFSKIGLISWHTELADEQQCQHFLGPSNLESLSSLSIPLLTTIGYSKTVQGIELHQMKKAFNTLTMHESIIKPTPTKEAFVA